MTNAKRPVSVGEIGDACLDRILAQPSQRKRWYTADRRKLQQSTRAIAAQIITIFSVVSA